MQDAATHDEGCGGEVESSGSGRKRDRQDAARATELKNPICRPSTCLFPCSKLNFKDSGLLPPLIILIGGQKYYAGKSS